MIFSTEFGNSCLCNGARHYLTVRVEFLYLGKVRDFGKVNPVCVGNPAASETVRSSLLWREVILKVQLFSAEFGAAEYPAN